MDTYYHPKDLALSQRLQSIPLSLGLGTITGLVVADGHIVTSVQGIDQLGKVLVRLPQGGKVFAADVPGDGSASKTVTPSMPILEIVNVGFEYSCGFRRLMRARATKSFHTASSSRPAIKGFTSS